MNYRRETSGGYLTNWAARLFIRAVERRLAGGAAGCMPVFFALADGSGMSQKQLALYAAVEQPTMANTLARMERDGLIVRQPSPSDRRSSVIRLSPLGQQHAELALKAAFDTNELALAGLDATERDAFLDMLKRVIAALDADPMGQP